MEGGILALIIVFAVVTALVLAYLFYKISRGEGILY
jgi:hypothetical protein